MAQPRITLRRITPDGERAITLLPPTALNAALRADPVGTTATLTAQPYPVLRTQAQAQRIWAAWYGDEPATRWWLAVLRTP
jgi:hypothetical protein